MPTSEEMFKYAMDVCENQITHYTIQLWKFIEKYDYHLKDNKKIPKAKGTGVLLKYIGKHFLLTAKHVIEDVSEENLLYFRSAPDEYLSITGIVGMMDTENDSEIDLAFVEISEENVKHLNAIINQKFLTPDHVGAGFQPAPNETIIACGYPDKKTQVDKKSLELNVVGQYKFLPHVEDSIYEHYKYDKQTKIGLSYHGKSFDIKTNQKINKVEPHGMSGGGIWKVGVEDLFGEDLVKFHLIGIMTNVENNKFHVIWSTRIELMMDFISSSYGMTTSIE